MSFIVYSVFYPCCEILGERDKGEDGRGDISASFHPLEAITDQGRVELQPLLRDTAEFAFKIKRA